MSILKLFKKGWTFQRFVFFVDLSVIDTKAKERILNILLENLIDKNAQQELKKSLL
jgi:hypothetical protein